MADQGEIFCILQRCGSLYHLRNQPRQRLQDSGGFLKPAGCPYAVREQDDKISRGTVYRNLNLLADAGEILSIKTPGGSRFDRTIEPHAHIICTSCSRVIDVPLPFDAQLDAKASEQIGWHVTSHYTIFEGLCPDCR